MVAVVVIACPLALCWEPLSSSTRHVLPTQEAPQHYGYCTYCVLVLPFFLVCDGLFVSLSIHYCPSAFSGTTRHESNHHLHFYQSSIHTFSHYL